jgi:hypothetical protein
MGKGKDMFRSLCTLLALGHRPIKSNKRNKRNKRNSKPVVLAILGQGDYRKLIKG